MKGLSFLNLDKISNNALMTALIARRISIVAMLITVL